MARFRTRVKIRIFALLLRNRKDRPHQIFARHRWLELVAGKAQPPTHPGPPTRRPHDAGRGAALPAWREHVSPVLRGTPITDRLLEAAGDFQHEETRAHHRWSPTLTGRLNGTPPCRSRPCHLGEGPSPTSFPSVGPLDSHSRAGSYGTELWSRSVL